MSKKAVKTKVGGYDASGAKKGPILCVQLSYSNDPLQFPCDHTYEFRTIAGDKMLVVMDPDGKVVAHIQKSAVTYVACPQYLIRDRDAK